MLMKLLFVVGYLLFVFCCWLFVFCFLNKKIVGWALPTDSVISAETEFLS